MRIDHKRRAWGILLLLVVSAGIFWWGGLDKVIAADSAGKAKAEELVAAYAQHVGAHDTVHQTLDENNDRSFGEFGFHYFPEQDVLKARMYIVRQDDANESPKTAFYVAKVDAGLNDPKIGGMYDRGGGYFHEDKQEQILFLVKDYKVSAISPSEFIRNVDNLRALSWIWVTSWFAHAARQSYGAEPPPTHFVDRVHNPYGTHGTLYWGKILDASFFQPRRGSRRFRGFNLMIPEYLKHSPQYNVRIIHRLTMRPLGSGSEHFKARLL